jgi:flagellar motor switch/type III secretory pathway protein FliN
MVLPRVGNFPETARAWAPRPIDRETARIASAVARWIPWSDGSAGHGRLAGEALRVRVVRIGAVAPDPDGAVAVIRGGPEAILVVGAGGLVRGLAQRVLGGPAELAASRPPTVAEQAVWALAVATAVDAAGAAAAIAVEPSRIAPAMVRAGAMIELAVELGAVRGAAWLALPAAVFDRPPPVTPLVELAARAAWLDDAQVQAHVVVAHAAFGLAEIERLAVRDAIVVGALPGSLRVARGEVPVSIEAGADRVTVRGSYQRGRMDETLGDDLTVELAVSAGTVSVGARRLLELAPGEVLSLGRPAAGAVELVIGRRVIGRGELIDVDGELAVRVLAIESRRP